MIASVDTHAKRGDSTQIEAPSLMGGAVPAGQTPKLRVVHEEPVDIQALNRAEIEARDWSACHVNGDRGPVVCWQTRVRRWWRG